MTLSAAADRARGVAYSAGAYVLWGLIPLYFLLLAPMSADEIVGWRVVFSMTFCVILVTVVRGWTNLRALLRHRRTVVLSGVGAVVIYLNWWLFTMAATTGNVVEAALGYFITPLVSVVLGVTFFHERLRPLQAVAFALSAVAVVILGVLYGHVPWTALAMAATFGLYGFIKKLVGTDADAVSGLAIETAWTLPLAAAQLVFVACTTGLQIGTLGALNMWALPFSGLVTALPLLLFAAGTRRVPLVFIGMLQFIEPIIQFFTGALLLHEPMPPERLLGFGFVWLAVALLVIDAIRGVRAHRSTSGKDVS